MNRAVFVVATLIVLPGVARAQQPCTTDAAAVATEIHRQVLERPPDNVSALADRLANGSATPKDLIAELARGVEHKSRFLSPFNNDQQRLAAIGYLYRHLLNRPPDMAGANQYEEIARTRGVDFVINDILNSPEYRESFGTDRVPGSSVRYCGPNYRDTRTAVPRSNQMRFRDMDADNDGRISRREWRGSAQSFNVHDWNNDGVLSGEEVRPGGVRSRRLEEDDYLIGGRNTTPAWTDAEFRTLDRNNDRRIARSEWFYDSDTFYRTDRNGDGVLTSAEFLAPDDADRNDSFEYLDVNNNNRVERTEWHGTPGEFSRLDRNRDNALTRAELLGGTTAAPGTADLFNTLDANEDDRISSIEWRWSLRSFDRADVNNDGFLSRDEFTGRPGTGLGTTGR